MTTGGSTLEALEAVHRRRGQGRPRALHRRSRRGRRGRVPGPRPRAGIRLHAARSPGLSRPPPAARFRSSAHSGLADSSLGTAGRIRCERNRRTPSAACWIAVALAALLLGSVRRRSRHQDAMRITISNSADSVSEFRPRIAGRRDRVAARLGRGFRGDAPRRQADRQHDARTASPTRIPRPTASTSSGNRATPDSATSPSTTCSRRPPRSCLPPATRRFPLVSGSDLAWIEMVDADGEVFVDPGPLGNQLTGNALVESEFKHRRRQPHLVRGRRPAPDARHRDDSHDVAVWNGALQGLYILTGPGTDDIHPAIAGDIVVWQAGPDGSGDIWYGDTLGTSNLLFDGTDERNPRHRRRARDLGALRRARLRSLPRRSREPELDDSLHQRRRRRRDAADRRRQDRLGEEGDAGRLRDLVLVEVGAARAAAPPRRTTAATTSRRASTATTSSTRAA